MTDDRSQDRPRRIVVVGSLNMDLVLSAARCPEAGETLTGHGFAVHPGGKGANQAIACARLGAPVAMVGRLGQDGFAATLRQGLLDAGIDADAVGTDPSLASGTAMIIVEDSGQNRILLAPGANAALSVAAIDAEAERIAQAALLVLQLEVPFACVERAIAIAADAGVPILFNPAPAAALDAGLIAKIDYLVVNETEAALIAGHAVIDRASATIAAGILLSMGARHVLLTLGAEGALVADGAGVRHYPAFPTTVVDTTAAGDTFIGGLAAALIEGATLDRAVRLGMAASAICVSRPGAQPSIPFRAEVVLAD
ncbi:ribokinase [Paludibacterium yongneupense]|uniref:ribokinase n=1 Tax=Paludibacterium yongneupense TaxID=400061 RepID=UPI0004146716|nr:ribokinase [Paludibacterium yongneupense]